MNKADDDFLVLFSNELLRDSCGMSFVKRCTGPIPGGVMNNLVLTVLHLRFLMFMCCPPAWVFNLGHPAVHSSRPGV